MFDDRVAELLDQVCSAARAESRAAAQRLVGIGEVARAIESLWDVGRRRLTGKSGSILYIARSVAETVVYGLLSDSLNVVDTFTFEMPKLNEDNSLGGVDIGCRMHYIPDDYELQAGVYSTECPRISLPARQRDQRAYSTSKRKIYPFSPNGSQKV